MNLQPLAPLLIVAGFLATYGFADEPGAFGAGFDPSGLPVRLEGFEEVQAGVYRDGRVLIAGQPSVEALQHFKDLGVTAVVNLRTPSEMNNRERVPFDEAAAVEEIGMEYVHIPLGGDEHPYDPAAVSAFAAVLEKHPGPILLHCTVAWRASHLWVAYLVLYRDFPLDKAVESGEAIAISPPPLEGLLGRPLTLVYEN